LISFPPRTPPPRRGVGRCSYSLLARPFVCECHNISTMPRHRFFRPLRRYYEIVRLPGAVHVGLSALCLPRPSHAATGAGNSGLSRFSRMEFPDMLRVLDSAASKDSSRWRCPSCGLPLVRTRSARRSGDFGARYLACLYPCLMLHLRPRGRRRQTRGQDGSLLLSCVALSSTTPCRFIPALSLTPRSSLPAARCPLPALPIRASHGCYWGLT
jgi:hypothetical protein